MEHQRGGAKRLPSGVSKTVSRVLYLTVIYLDVPLPARSSHPGSGRASLGGLGPPAPIPVLLRIEFTASDSLQPMGALLPHLSTLTDRAACPNTPYPPQQDRSCGGHLRIPIRRRKMPSEEGLFLRSPKIGRSRRWPRTVKVFTSLAEISTQKRNDPLRRLRPPPARSVCLDRQPCRRYISVALFLKSPSAGVTRYPCPAEPGLSSRTAFRPGRATVCLTHGPYCTGRSRNCQRPGPR